MRIPKPYKLYYCMFSNQLKLCVTNFCLKPKSKRNMNCTERNTNKLAIVNKRSHAMWNATRWIQRNAMQTSQQQKWIKSKQMFAQACKHGHAYSNPIRSWSMASRRTSTFQLPPVTLKCTCKGFKVLKVNPVPSFQPFSCSALRALNNECWSSQASTMHRDPSCPPSQSPKPD